MSGNRPTPEIAFFRDVPEHEVIEEQSFSRGFHSGQLLDGRFLLRDPLNSGGMAVIYKAEDTWNQNETVVVKAPQPRCESDPNFFLRFQREEEIGRKLDHPYLLKFVPVEKKSRPYIVTEYVRGCTLARLLKSRRPPESDALQIVSLLCEALRHMHEHGVVHRDLKPENIMICRDGSIRIIDFGIAGAAGSRRITLNGLTSTLGTPDYMSPEQVKNKRGDARTDIYSAGVILYELLTGVVPFQNIDPWAALEARVSGDPAAPRKLNPKISPAAEEIALHAMRRDPAARYQSAAAMKADLDAPGQVELTGYCKRLESPRRRMSLRGSPFLVGVLLALGFMSLQAVAFFLLRHYLSR